MNKEAAQQLREPFPPSAIGQLPKAGMMLDYVGHAATTDRLLAVDPEWSWEPFALDEHGLPALDEEGNLWIRLTVCGVTRPGVGDGKTAKERIGDAIRNAAMRFGVALDLWAKEDLQSNGKSDIGDDIRERQKARILARQRAAVPDEIPFGDDQDPGASSPPGAVQSAPTPAAPRAISHAQRRRLFAMAREVGMSEDHLRSLAEALTGTPSTKEMTVEQYESLCTLVEGRKAMA